MAEPDSSHHLHQQGRRRNARRLGSLIGPVAQRMWVSTFHSACVRILRRDGKSIGLKSGFSIYDSADSERLVKIIATEFNLDIKRYTPRSILGISPTSRTI